MKNWTLEEAFEINVLFQLNSGSPHPKPLIRTSTTDRLQLWYQKTPIARISNTRHENQLTQSPQNPIKNKENSIA